MARQLLQLHNAILFLAFLSTAALFGLNQVSTRELLVANTWVNHTHLVLESIGNVQHSLDEAEKSRRAYLLTRDQRFFIRYTNAEQILLTHFDTLQDLTADNLIQQEKIGKLRPLLSDFLVQAQQSFLNTQPAEMALHALDGLSDSMQTAFNAMRTEEERLLNKRNTTLSEHQQTMQTYNLLLKVMVIVFFGLGTFFYLRENQRRKKMESGLIESQQLATSTVHNLTLLGEMSSLLQSARDMDESFKIVGHFTERLMPVEAGALYLFRESRNQLELKTSWGSELKSEAIFVPESCWALRRGHEHGFESTQDSLPCAHVTETENTVTLCQPISAQGMVQGIIYFQRNIRAPFNINERKLLSNLSSQVALSLANMRLRETLRDQSVRDPLTGLFNRRYMEESLNQVFAHASRKELSFGLAILDIDHFKQFNDGYGHDAGDTVIREVGRLLVRSLRTSDIACRFGGEEFVLIFPEANLDTVARRCNEIRETIQSLTVKHMTQSLGKVTISAGVAVYPDHATTVDDLISAADKALYAAKQAGRNRVTIAKD